MSSQEKYNASSIKILSEEEARKKFQWVNTGELAKKYNVNEEFIKLGLISCDAIGLGFQNFIDKYLKKIDIPKNKELEEAYKHLLQKKQENEEERFYRRRIVVGE